MIRYIALLGSLDTKGTEIAFLKSVIEEEDGRPLIVDTGVLGRPNGKADIPREEVAKAADTSIEELIGKNDKKNALMKMAEGAQKLLWNVYRQNELGAILSIGGSRGTALSTRVMQAFPIGLPKFMVSTLASGKYTFGPYVGTKDIIMMHSVADILGINTVTKAVFTQAAAGITAMARRAEPITGDAKTGKPVFTASMLGLTNALIERIQQQMLDDYELIAFHAIGSGGSSMEELIASGIVSGVFELTPGEVMAHIAGGSSSAGPDRMQNAADMGLPQVIGFGGIDFLIEGPPDTLTPQHKKRKTLAHTPTITLVRTSPDEMKKAARHIAGILNSSKGPVTVLLPLKGFGLFSVEGAPLYDPVSDRAFIEEFKKALSDKIDVIELDTNMSDPALCDIATESMIKMLD